MGTVTHKVCSAQAEQLRRQSPEREGNDQKTWAVRREKDIRRLRKTKGDIVRVSRSYCK